MSSTDAQYDRDRYAFLALALGSLICLGFAIPALGTLLEDGMDGIFLLIAVGGGLTGIMCAVGLLHRIWITIEQNEA